jgi:drug/metabolite transporter (DMT)-like permease
MILTTLVFACMDGISRHLAGAYNVMTVALLRYWFFAAFVIAAAAARPGGIRAVARSAAPRLQILRGVLLTVELCIVVLSFVLLGLIGTHAIFACYPLLVAALAGPVLGERVGWRRRVAIAIGLVGVLVILRPGFHVFSPAALIALGGTTLFAIYALLTRKVAMVDPPETSLFYIGVVGAATITLVAPFWWTPMQGWADWGWMLALCILGILGHFLMIKAYALAEAGTVQPFAYFQLVFVAIIGLTLFDERPDAWTVAGAGLILAAGLYTILREARLARMARMARRRP